jgi:hypothetical protein
LALIFGVYTSIINKAIQKLFGKDRKRERIMDNFEKVEKLRERANVTYEEAKQALENSNWDILDAMIYLEQNGKVPSPEKSNYTTKDESIKIEVEDKEPKKSVWHRFWTWCLKWIKKGNDNCFCVDRYDKEIIKMPINVLIVLILCSASTVFWIMIICLFFNFRYRFVGPDIRKVDFDINETFDKAADTVDNIKNEFGNSKEED